MIRTFQYRCYPTPVQAETLDRWQRACWEVQRLCIIERRQHDGYARRCKNQGFEPRVKAPSKFSQPREITQLRAIYPEFAAVPADTMSAVVKRVDQAWQAMWKERKAGNWRAKARWADTHTHIGLDFRGQDRGTRCDGEQGRYTYWSLASAGKSLGSIKVRWHRPLPIGATIAQSRLTLKSDGWYLSFVCDIPNPEPLSPSDKDINGVDLNVIHHGDDQQVAAVDDGRVYRSTDHLKRNARRLATYQRLVDPKRKVRGGAKAADPKSRRTAKRRARIAAMHQQIARQRDHTQHYIAKRLVETANTTAFERLNHEGMRRKGKGRRKRGLNRALSTAAPGALIQKTKVKAEAAGRAVVTVDPRYTSQDCSACGARGEHKHLSVRQWACAACGAVHDRDVNAARNIRKRAEVSESSSVIPPATVTMPGEGAAGDASERPSVNLEGHHARPLSNKGSVSSRGTKLRVKPVSPHQLALDFW